MKSLNCVVITKCVECSDRTPGGSAGDGTHCDELGRVVNDDSDAPIPDCCPRVSFQIEVPDGS